MRTAHPISYGGTLSGGFLSGGGGQSPPGHVTCGACWDRDPPPPMWTELQTGVKTLPCRNFVAGGNYV